LSQHHHRIDNLENASSPSQSNLTPFKNVKRAVIPSPPDAKAAPVLHHHHVSRHHHHQITPSKSEPVIKNVCDSELFNCLTMCDTLCAISLTLPMKVVVKLSKKIIRSQAVLDSVAHLPRKHLGHNFYKSNITPVGSAAIGPRSQIGFASTPEPLPNFEGSENCTFTVKIPRTYLLAESRREITYRKAVCLIVSHVVTHVLASILESTNCSSRYGEPIYTLMIPISLRHAYTKAGSAVNGRKISTLVF